MSFLSTLGKILAVGEEVAGVFFPVLRPFLGSGKTSQVITQGVNDFTQISSVIIGMEAAFQTPGAAGVKLQAALPQVANIVKTSEALAGHKIANEPEFIAGCTDLVNAFVRILNSYSDNGISGQGQKTDLSTSAKLATPVAVEMLAPEPNALELGAATRQAGLTQDTQELGTKTVHPLALS